MKICFLADELAPGSAPVIIGHTIRGLRKLGYDAECLLIVKRPYQEGFDYYLRNVEIKYIYDRIPKWLRWDFKFPGFSFFSLHHIWCGILAPFIFKRKEYDLIIANCQYTSFIARPLSIFKGIPYIQLIWDTAPYTLKKIYSKRMRLVFPLLNFFAHLLDNFAFGGCKSIITSGRMHHHYLKKYNKRIDILYPGCNPLKELSPFNKREKIILAYDRWDIGNIPNVYLDILEKLEDKEVKLVIAGFWHPESMEDNFRNEIDKRNLSNRVIVFWGLGEDEIYKLCSNAMVHLHCNEEAFGMQSLEAAACGCPIIIPEGSGVTELFDIDIYFPNKGDINTIVKYLNIIFKDKQKAEEISKKVWQRSKLYTWDDYATQLDNIIGGV